MKTYYQVLNDSGMYGSPYCVSYHETEEAAKEELDSWVGHTDYNWWIEQGTDFIRGLCTSCGTPETEPRFDAHGIETGSWCQPCYDSDKYPYRKDRYPTEETHGYGERLNDDY